MMQNMLSIFLPHAAAATEALQLGGLRLNLWWWPFVFAFVKNLFILIDIVLVLAAVMILSRFKSFRIRIYESVEEAIESGKLSKGKLARKWEEIQTRMESDNLEDKKRATVMAEEMLDSALKAANLPGENVEKRLAKFSDTDINFKEDIIWAHRLAERIKTGEEDYEIDEEEVKRAFYILERTMKELNIL